MIRVLIRQKSGRRNLTLYYVDPVSGREVTKSAETPRRSEAERTASRWEAELAKDGSVTDPTWEYFRQRFEGEHSDGLAHKTEKSYRTALNRFELDVGKPQRLRLIDSSVLSKWVAKMRDDGTQPFTMRTYLRGVTSALGWAHKIGMISRVPKCVLPKVGKRRMSRSRPLTDDEFRMLLAAVDDIDFRYKSELKLLVEGLWLSGLRLGEAFSLSWDKPPIMVDLDNGKFPRLIIHDVGQKSRKDEMSPLTPDFVEFLRREPIENRRGKVFRFPIRNRAVVDAISELGTQAKIIVNAKGKHATAHDLRRSFGTRWALKVHPLVLQRLMRHKEIQTTMNYYVDLDVEQVSEDLWKAVTVPAQVPKPCDDSKSTENK